MESLYTISASSKAGLIAEATKLLTEEGAFVEWAGYPESQPEFCARLGISPRTFRARLAWAKRMGRRLDDVKLKCGPHGRIIRIRSTPTFDRFMRRLRQARPARE